MKVHFIGVYAGTRYANAAVFDANGTMLASARDDIALFQSPGSVAEHSSENIWRAVCESTCRAVADSGVSTRSIKGIGFAATSSLVVVGPKGEPLSVGHSSLDRNTVAWMDRRAHAQTARINEGGHRVLDYLGGVISPEMQTPRLVWLKEHKSDTFNQAWQFFDLTDYLTWRATGSLKRSISTVVSKWTYLGHEAGWDREYFDSIGLGDLACNGFERIGADVVPAGTALGSGLCKAAASEMNLPGGTPVAAGLIDAHASALATLAPSGAPGSIETRMAYVFGVSACAITLRAEQAFVPGIWGPYYSAVMPGAWLLEGGQTTAGSALDYLLDLHPAIDKAREEAAFAGLGFTQWLGWRLQHRDPELSQSIQRVGDLHVVPEFLDNRAPFAEAEARAIIYGLAMDNSIDALLTLYVAGICSLGYGARQIVATLRKEGQTVDAIMISGEFGQSTVVRQLLADSIGVEICATQAHDPVLLGSAMLGALAAGHFCGTTEAMAVMSEIGATYRPHHDLAKVHEGRFAAFEHLQAAARDLRQIARNARLRNPSS